MRLLSILVLLVLHNPLQGQDWVRFRDKPGVLRIISNTTDTVMVSGIEGSWDSQPEFIPINQSTLWEMEVVDEPSPISQFAKVIKAYESWCNEIVECDEYYKIICDRYGAHVDSTIYEPKYSNRPPKNYYNDAFDECVNCNEPPTTLYKKTGKVCPCKRRKIDYTDGHIFEWIKERGNE